MFTQNVCHKVYVTNLLLTFKETFQTAEPVVIIVGFKSFGKILSEHLELSGTKINENQKHDVYFTVTRYII